MEDVLRVYTRPVQANRPLVSRDEFAEQLLSETHVPVPAIPGHLAREDYEYVREGSVGGFMVAMPHPGKRDVFLEGDGRRTSLDFAACPYHVANNLFPEAGKIVLVMDNLNTRKEAFLYEAFPPEKARALCGRFEMHYTPKHGSWLNMAEIEIGLLSQSCLDRRIGPKVEFKDEVEACLLGRMRNQNLPTGSSPTRKPVSNSNPFIRQFEFYETLVEHGRFSASNAMILKRSPARIEGLPEVSV